VSDIVPTAARFSNRVEDYVRYRPSYPAAAIDALLAGLGDPGALTAADIGAGTGISARLLAERGLRVVAIEPNPAMRAAIGDDAIEARDGLATATTLAAASVDLVTAFQAFHWFSTPEAVREFRRIVRPAGRIAAVWNVRDDADHFTRRYGDIAESIERASHSMSEDEADALVLQLFVDGGLENVRRTEFAYGQRLGLDALLGRARSSSYVPRDGPGWETIAAQLREHHAAFADAAGAATIVYRTVLYAGEEPAA
jgi:SAM-dependent methyltransferase